VTSWDVRAFARALAAALVALAVVWLVTAASDEGQLTASARAGRTLPLAPLCSAVGAALALGTARVREETLALEALGRSPLENLRAAAMGAALPSFIVAIVIALSARVDVSAFYPHAARSEVFVREGEAFTSPTLGVRVDDATGEPHPLPGGSPDEGLPGGARASAAIATALAGLALALVASRAVLRPGLLGPREARRRRALAIAQGVGCALASVIAFQAAAAKVAPAALAIAPPCALLAVFALRYRRARGDA
jgi:hypothetical protein